MGLLKSTSKHPNNLPFKSVFIKVWEILIKICNIFSLAPHLASIFVALESYVADYPTQIKNICDYLLHENQSTLSVYFSDLFFINKTSYSSDIKSRVSSLINSQSMLEGNNNFETILQRLIKYMRSESADSDVSYLMDEFYVRRRLNIIISSFTGQELLFAVFVGIFKRKF